MKNRKKVPLKCKQQKIGLFQGQTKVKYIAVSFSIVTNFKNQKNFENFKKS